MFGKGLLQGLDDEQGGRMFDLGLDSSIARILPPEGGSHTSWVSVPSGFSRKDAGGVQLPLKAEATWRLSSLRSSSSTDAARSGGPVRLSQARKSGTTSTTSSTSGVTESPALRGERALVLGQRGVERQEIARGRTARGELARAGDPSVPRRLIGHCRHGCPMSGCAAPAPPTARDGGAPTAR